MNNSAHPFRAILQRTLQTVDGQGSLTRLDPSRTALVHTVVESLICRKRSRPLLLYRGDSKKHLRTQIFRDKNGQNSDGMMYAKVFYFGQKARHFWQDQNQDIYRRNWLISLHDDSSDTFAWLFNNVGRVLGYDLPNVHRFCKQNINFSDYFKDQKNKKDFVGRAALLSPKEKQKFRDYYLYVLHTFGRKGIHKPTLLISASSDLCVALKFQKANAENVVFYTFVPAPYSKYCVSSRFGRKDIETINNIGGPLYLRNTGFYPAQREYGFRGAIFPQFILGIHDRVTEEFIVNPYIFDANSFNLARLFKSGIPIDQSDFENLIPQTGFQRSASLDEDGLYSGQ